MKEIIKENIKIKKDIVSLISWVLNLIVQWQLVLYMMLILVFCGAACEKTAV